MREGRGVPAPSPAAAVWPIFAGLGVLTWAVVAGQHTRPAAMLLLALLVFSVGYRWIFAWPTLIGTTILVILWIPIRRFELPGSLPFSLEPYRVMILVLGLCWVASLLVDRRVQLRRTPIDGPLLLVVLVAAASVAANSGRLADGAVNDSVWKAMLFLVSYPIFFYAVVSVTKTYADVERLVRIFVAGGAVVALFAIVEARTQWNFFDHFAARLPGLTYLGPETGDFARGGHERVLASAEHPIALSAMLVMLVPLALAVGNSTRQKRWWIAAALRTMAALATLSRTGVVMLLVIGVVFAVLRRGSIKRIVPFILPGLVALHFVLPGTIGSFKDLFFPSGGLVAEQSSGRVGSSRGASFHAGIPVVKQQPLLGQGYGTRLRGQDSGGQNSFILDDQWLGTAMETGLLGVFAWLWLFGRSIRRLGRAAKDDDGPRGLLLTGLTAGIAAFGVGMIYYDAFSFVQVTFVLFLFLAIGCAALAADRPRPPTEAAGG